MVSELPPLPAGSLISRQLAPRLEELSGELLDAAVASLLWSDTVPQGHFNSEVGPAIISGAIAFLRAMDEGRDPTKAEVADIVIPVVERHFVDRRPLPALMTGLHAGIARLWNVIVDLATDDRDSSAEDAASIALFGARLTNLLGTITVVVTETYQDADLALRTMERDAQRTLCSMLVRGESADGLAAEAGIALSDGYHVVALEVGTTAQQRDLTGALVARRRMRLAQQILDEFGVANVVSNFDGCSGTLLLPAVPDGPRGADLAHSRRLITAIGDRLEVDIYAAESYAAGRPAITAAAQETSELARLARQLKRPPGLYRLNDLMFEYQVTRPGPVRDELAQRIAPLRQHPHLLRTLQLHLKHGSDRKAAAGKLFVHPNTFSYRLRRVGELTGIDPGDPDGSRLLAAALTIHLVDVGSDELSGS